MEELTRLATTGEVTTTGLLLFMILCLLTGRITPWWQVKGIKDKLEEYEKAAPQLIDEVQKLIALQERESVVSKVRYNVLRRERKPNVRRVTNPRQKP